MMNATELEDKLRNLEEATATNKRQNDYTLGIALNAHRRIDKLERILARIKAVFSEEQLTNIAREDERPF